MPPLGSTHFVADRECAAQMPAAFRSAPEVSRVFQRHADCFGCLPALRHSSLTLEETNTAAQGGYPHGAPVAAPAPGQLRSLMTKYVMNAPVEFRV